MLDPRLLRSFVAVVDGNGFSSAARRLNATQPAVSARIKTLEQQVGKPLLLRSTRSGVELTSEGQRVLDAARGILERLDRLEHDLRDDPLTGTAQIGMTDDFATGPDMVRALADFARLHPGIALQVIVDRRDRLLAMMEDRELDLAMIRRVGTAPVDTVLRRDTLVWVAHRDYQIDPDKPLPLICASAPCDVREAAVRSLEEAGIAWRHAFTSLSLATQLSAIEARLGVAPLTSELMRPGLRTIDDIPGPGNVCLVLVKRDNITKAASTLGDVIRGAFRDGLEAYPTR